MHGCILFPFQLVTPYAPSPLNMSSLKVLKEFMHKCFEMMRRVWENLVAFKEGESEQKVVGLTRCLCLLKEYLDGMGFLPHGKYVACTCCHFVVPSHLHHFRACANRYVFGVSLSEPRTDAVAGDFVGIYIYVCVCRTSCHKFPFSHARLPHSVT